MYIVHLIMNHIREKHRGNKESLFLPGRFGAGLQKGVSKQSDWPIDWLMDPGVIFLSEVAHLPSQGLPPVHQILKGHKRLKKMNQ